MKYKSHTVMHQNFKTMFCNKITCKDYVLVFSLDLNKFRKRLKTLSEQKLIKTNAHTVDT